MGIQAFDHSKIFQSVWLSVLIGGNENNLLCKFSRYVTFYSHGNETLIIKSFFIHNSPLQLNITYLNDNTLKWNLWMKKNEIVEIEKAWALNLSRYIPLKLH